jgi:hypothetical protein
VKKPKTNKNRLLGVFALLDRIFSKEIIFPSEALQWDINKNDQPFSLRIDNTVLQFSFVKNTRYETHDLYNSCCRETAIQFYM